MVPAVQFNGPPATNRPVPPSVPAVIVTADTEAGVTLLKLNVPPLIRTVAVPVADPLKLAVAALHPTAPLPASQELASSVCVPPPKSSVAVPTAALVPLLRPPACKLKIPLSASTVPVPRLLKRSVIALVPVPPVFRNSPAL